MFKNDLFSKNEQTFGSGAIESLFTETVGKEQSTLLSTFFEDAPQCIFVFDAGFSLSAVNAEGRRLCCLTKGQSVGVPLWDVLCTPFGSQTNLQECLVRSFRETISTRMPVTLLLSSTDAAIAIASDKLAVPGLGLLREGAGIWHLCHQPIFSSDSRISGIVTYLTTLGLLDKTCEQLALTGLQSSVPVATVTGGKKVVATDASRLKIPPAPLAASTLKNFKDEEGKHRASIRCLQILLVEDNEDLRITAGEHLRLLGHEVTAAPDAERAQQYLAEGTFDLLFTDLTLPKMTGADLARWALRDFPQMQVVITSGYGRAMADVNDLDAFFLPKPYQRADLENLLARVDPR